MSMVFYQEGLDCLKVTVGKESDFYYVLRISSPKHGGHLTFGRLLEKGKQLFGMFLPKLLNNSYLQMRQDTEDGNTIDLEIITWDKQKNKFPIEKPIGLHHQQPNNEEFYYKEVSYNEFKIQVAINRMGYDDLMQKFRTKFLS